MARPERARQGGTVPLGNSKFGVSLDPLFGMTG